MRKLLLPAIILWSILSAACNETGNQQPSSATALHETAQTALRDNDSLALLQLTRKLYQWVEENNNTDFSPYLNQPDDTLYAGIDLNAQQKRLKEITTTGLFTPAFIDNYNKIALAIDKEIKNQALIWPVGELPPFGNGANPWCDCQDTPDNYLDKIWIMHLSIKNDTASYNWSWGDGLVYQMKALKEKGIWKIAFMEGFDYNTYLKSFVYTNKIDDSWENSMVRIDIGDKILTFWYHGQCVYFYPIRKINEQTVEMIWDRDMDCKFDNGTDQTFGLKKVPVKGQPFAKFTLNNNVLYADYYYKEWIEQYTRQVESEVFTPTYLRRNEH